MKVSYTHEIPMGHRLARHKGKCRFLHGHNYLVHVEYDGDVDPTTGMVIDFHDLKEAVRKALERFDHAFVLEEGDNFLREVEQERIIYIPNPPTAEVLAALWRNRVIVELGRQNTKTALTVTVHETRDCSVTA